MALLDMGGSARAKLMELIEITKSQTYDDQQQHTFSMGMKGMSRGIAFVAAPRSHTHRELFEATVSFCVLKKYSEKCDEFFGFGWRADSSRIVDTSVAVKFRWEENAEMESAVRDFLRPGRRIDSP